MTMPRASVVRVRLLAAAPLPAPAVDHEEPELPAKPERNRYLAVNLSVAPGFDLDLDAGLFHGFANLGIILPLATNGNIVPFSLGLGIGIPVSRSAPRLKLDLFAHVNIVGNASANTAYSSSSSLGWLRRRPWPPLHLEQRADSGVHGSHPGILDRIRRKKLGLRLELQLGNLHRRRQLLLDER